jgi:L-alanine-DL-glutamate epimerase-like enolase superfamily enzyme
MKITHTDIYRYSIRIQPFTIATGTMTYAQNMLIRLHTDEGIYGMGECSAFPVITGESQDTCLAMAKSFASVWKGKDINPIDERLHELNLVTARNTTAKSAFDMALYDLAAKAANVPLYQFLGGSKREVETDMTIGIGSASAMAETAVHYKQSGARIIKVKLGKNIKDDVERIQHIRNAIGPDIKLRLDANQGWSLEDAVYGLQAMQEFNIEFCEQPLHTGYDDYLPDLCLRSPIAIMADESCYTYNDARKLIKAKACHSINIKFAKSGGIFEGKKIQDIAQETNTPCMIGGMLESRLAVTANLHFVYASPAVQYYDLDSCLIGQLEDPVIGGCTYNNYKLDLTDAAGIGADVDESFLKNCEMQTI